MSIITKRERYNLQYAKYSTLYVAGMRKTKVPKWIIHEICNTCNYDEKEEDEDEFQYCGDRADCRLWACDHYYFTSNQVL